MKIKNEKTNEPQPIEKFAPGTPVRLIGADGVPRGLYIVTNPQCPVRVVNLADGDFRGTYYDGKYDHYIEADAEVVDRS